MYSRLQERLKAANAFDFDDLLLYAYLLLKNHEDVRSAYQQRFRYIMVDEYQDTNHAQYSITGLLAEGHKNIMVVGDDDQSIYKFREANIKNILNFESEFPDATVIKLEQNYRSTQNILNAANGVIANNTERKEKTLWTENPEGEKIHFRQFMNGYEEAEFVVGDIADDTEKGQQSIITAQYFIEQMRSPVFLKRSVCLQTFLTRS